VLPAAVALLVVAILAVAGTVTAYWPRGGGPAAVPSVAPEPDPDLGLLLGDSLLQRRLWEESTDADERASCSFAGGLIVRRETKGVYRCRGPEDAMPEDLQAEVGVRLLTANSCASIWLRFRSFRGYQVRVCEHNVYVGTHKSTETAIYKTFPLDDGPIGVGAPATRITVSIIGDTLEVLRDGELVGSVLVQDKEIVGGRVVLGIFTERNSPVAGPYEVAFNDIKIWPISR